MHTLFFVERLQEITDPETNEIYEAYVIGPKIVRKEKVFVVGSQGNLNLILYSTSRSKDAAVAKTVDSYVGDSYQQIILDSFVGITDEDHQYVGNPAIAKCIMEVVYAEEVEGETVRHTMKLGDWLDAGQPGTKIRYKKPLAILGVAID